MKRALKWIVLAGLIGVGGFYVFNSPRVQEIVSSPSRPETSKVPKSVPDLSTEEPRPRPRTKTPKKAIKVSKEVSPAPAEPSPSVREGQLPNRDLSRVLMQILGAQKLTSGISIGVDDDQVSLFGEVDSEEKRRKIISIVNRGRGARRLDSSNLNVSPEH